MNSISSVSLTAALSGSKPSAVGSGSGNAASTTATVTNADGSITTTITNASGVVISSTTEGGQEDKPPKGPGSIGSQSLLDINA